VKESFGKEYLDEIVINQTIIYLENWKNIERIYTQKINEIEDQSNEDKRDIDILRKQEKKVNTRYERLIDAIADGTITNEEVKPKLNKLRQEKEEIQNKIQEIEKKREEEKKEWDYILAKLSHDKIHELNWAYEDGDENQVSNILRSLIREGTFNNYNLHLEYITGDTYDIDVKNLPDLLYKRIYGLDILDDQT
jgi:predicted thioredoxin/glutaredoxin